MYYVEYQIGRHTERESYVSHYAAMKALDALVLAGIQATIIYR